MNKLKISFLTITAALFILGGCKDDDDPDVFGIMISQTALYKFPPAADSNYAVGEERTLTVSVINVGNRPTGALNIFLEGPGSGDFELSENTIADIAPDGIAEFKIKPKLGLPDEENYAAVVTVASSNKGIGEKNFDVLFVITTEDVEEMRWKSVPQKILYGVSEPVDLTDMAVEVMREGKSEWEPFEIKARHLTHNFGTPGAKTVRILVGSANPLEYQVTVQDIGERVRAALGTTATIYLYASEVWNFPNPTSDMEVITPILINVDGTDITLTTPPDSDTERVLQKSVRGQLFRVGNADAKLTIDGYVTLKGLTSGTYGGSDELNNNTWLLSVAPGGFVHMKGYSKVTGNANVAGGPTQAGGIRVTGESWDRPATLILDENAEVSNNMAVAISEGALSYGGGVMGITYSIIYLKGDAKIKGNISHSLTGRAFGGGFWHESWGRFYMEGGEISNNGCIGGTMARGGGLHLSNASSRAFLSGGVIKDNWVQFGSSGGGGAIGVGDNNTLVLSGTINIPPKAGGTYKPGESDDRNTIWMSENANAHGFIHILGTLNLSSVPVVDLQHNWSFSTPLLRKMTSEIQPPNNPFEGENYASGAPKNAFALGHTLDIDTGAIVPLSSYEIKDDGTIGAK